MITLSIISIIAIIAIARAIMGPMGWDRGMGHLEQRDYYMVQCLRLRYFTAHDC
jgi:hypothetical protein